MTIRAFAKDLLSCTAGAMAVETVIVAPVLALMALGTFEVGTMVARQHELQSAASEAESIILAAAGSETDSGVIKQIIVKSMGLEEDQVEIRPRFRCGSTAGEPIEDATGCTVDEPIYRYILLELDDSYTPVWANYGVGSPFDYSISRTILIR